MKIFKIEGEEGFELAQPVLDEDFTLLHSAINGTPQQEKWHPIPVKVINKEQRRRSLRRSDAPWFGSDVLILRQQAAETLKQFLTSHGELLPLECAQAELVAFNTFNLIDALDEDASTVERFDDGRIWLIDKHVFLSTAIADKAFFKITSLLHSPLFVGEEFMERWHAADLKGLKFRQVWEG